MSYLSPSMSLTLTNIPINFTVTLPLSNRNGTFKVNWGDTIENTNVLTHKYTQAGTYTIEISVIDDGSAYIKTFGLPRNNWVGSAYLTSINDWGNFNGLTTLNYIGGPLLSQVPATIPNTVTNMDNMFTGATIFNQDIDGWNVGGVLTMRGMFTGAEYFNGNITSWNPQNVAYMTGMFLAASQFNQDIGGWNVGNVIDMNFMFYAATNFNGNIGEWNVGPTTTMLAYMFFDASNFNQNLGGWNVSNVKNMTFMFTRATSFDAFNYSATLIGWAALPSVQPNVQLSLDPTNASIYDLAIPAYNILRNDYNWNITPTLANINIIGTLSPMSLILTDIPDNFTVALPLAELDGDFLVIWDDSNITLSTLGHTYDISGTYTIQISVIADGSYIHKFGSDMWPGIEYVTSINAWGDFNGLTTLNYVGRNTLTSVPATLPNTVTNLDYLFYQCYVFTQDINGWDVSGVQTMRYMFYQAITFNGDITGWNVGQVLDMEGMFQYATNFSQNLGGWNVSSVQNMSGMLVSATSVNTSNYSDMIIGWASLPSLQTGVILDLDPNASIYDLAVSAFQILTGQIGGENFWNITPDINTINIIATKLGPVALTLTAIPNNFQVSLPLNDISGSFLVQWGDYRVDTDVRDHTYIVGGNYEILFRAFNDDSSYIHAFGFSNRPWTGSDYVTSINSWGALNGLTTLNYIGGPALTSVPIRLPSTVTNIAYMFNDATIFNQDIGGWDVSGVEVMRGLFSNANSFDKDISSWQISKVTDMSYMFNGAQNFNQDISVWDVSGVQNMSAMFNGALAFNKDIGIWDVGNVTNMSNMFNCLGYGGVTVFNQDISGWQVGNVTNMSNMFSFSSFNQDIGRWDVGKVSNMSNMFSTNAAFNKNIGTWNIGINVTSDITMNNMFASATAFNQDISGWHVDKVTNMSNMFSGAIAFNKDIGNWDVGNVQLMDRMFANAAAFNKDISGWQVGNVQNMAEMFNGATDFNQNIGKWNVGKVTEMTSMFATATAFNQDIGTWDVSGVEFMGGMFAGATAFNQDISGWQVGNVTNMSNMFASAIAFNQNIGNWNVGSVEFMDGMFNDATIFNQNLGNWNVGNVSSMINMFVGATAFSPLNYSTTLIGWAARPSLISDVYLDLDPGAAIGDNAFPAYKKLIDQYNWQITPIFSSPPPPPFYRMIRSLYSDNSLVYYKPHSLSASIGLTVRNSRVVSKRT